MRHVLMIFVFSVVGFASLCAMDVDTRKGPLSAAVTKMESLDLDDSFAVKAKLVDNAKKFKAQALAALKDLNKDVTIHASVRGLIQKLIQELQLETPVVDGYSGWIEKIKHILSLDWDAAAHTDVGDAASIDGVPAVAVDALADQMALVALEPGQRQGLPVTDIKDLAPAVAPSRGGQALGRTLERGGARFGHALVGEPKLMRPFFNVPARGRRGSVVVAGEGMMKFALVTHDDCSFKDCMQALHQAMALFAGVQACVTAGGTYGPETMRPLVRLLGDVLGHFAQCPELAVSPGNQFFVELGQEFAACDWDAAVYTPQMIALLVRVYACVADFFKDQVDGQVPQFSVLFDENPFAAVKRPARLVIPPYAVNGEGAVVHLRPSKRGQSRCQSVVRECSALSAFVVILLIIHHALVHLTSMHLVKE